MSNVRKMPGDECRFYVAGRCLYHERLNPGYDESFRCRFLVLWEEEFDAFLDRAEAFSLGRRETVELWNRRFEKLQGGDCGCPDYYYHEAGGDQGCVHGYNDLCILALPLCKGRCRHFESTLLEKDNPNHTDKES
jgi:hypothetical protein